MIFQGLLTAMRSGPEEKLALAFAEAMSQTPAEVPAELRDRLLKRVSPAQITELAATVA